MSLAQSSHSSSLKLMSDIPFPTAQGSSTSRSTHRTKLLHLPSMPPLHLLHISRPKMMQRHTEPAKLKFKCSSGPSKKTHPTLVTCTNQRRGIIEQRDIYICLDAVNAPRLVTLTRAAMDAQVQCWGGNALVDESCVEQLSHGFPHTNAISATADGLILFNNASPIMEAASRFL